MNGDLRAENDLTLGGAASSRISEGKDLMQPEAAGWTEGGPRYPSPRRGKPDIRQHHAEQY